MCTSAQTAGVQIVTPPNSPARFCRCRRNEQQGLCPDVCRGGWQRTRHVGVKMANKQYVEPPGIPTGSDALDVILAGGYAAGRVHLLEGRPGSGKTTLALQFLMA